MKAEKSNLFTPLQIGNIEIKNRVVMPPMCMYSAEDGMIGIYNIMLLEQ